MFRTSDSLIRLLKRIQKELSGDLITLACVIDIDPAYNNIEVVSLQDILKKASYGSWIGHIRDFKVTYI